MERGGGWATVIRVVIGGYFAWRGAYKLLTPPAVWMVPRLTGALPSTPLAPLIRRWVFPHAAPVGVVLGLLEIVGGLGLIVVPAMWVWPLFLAGLNAVFLLTLGFHEPHDLELNLLMGVINLQMATAAWRRRVARGRATAS